MHLAVTFADVIIKIKKMSRPSTSVKDEISYYGVIDDSCVFLRNEDATLWSNGSEEYTSPEFELYLKRW